MAHDVKLGTLIDDQQQRDAIHIAIAPVIAAPGEKLHPGQDIGFVDSGDTSNVGSVSKPIGIVDPFLRGPVYQGDRFYMFLYPQTITSLRHDWTHPAFAPVAVSDKAASERWLRDVAAPKCGMDYVDMMAGAHDFITSGHHTIEHGSQQARDGFYDLGPEIFWGHYQTVTGEHVNEEDKHSAPFCCSC